MTTFQRRGLLAVTVVALLGLGWILACQLSENRESTLDDSFITYVYARNLAEGYGIRFNKSDDMPTEGSSSILHVFVVAALLMVGAEPLAAARIVSLFSYLAIPLCFGPVLSYVIRAPLSTGLLSALSVHVLLSLLPETQWHLANGMETILYSAIHGVVFAWVVFVTQDRRPSSALSGVVGTFLLTLLSMVRPEGILLSIGYLSVISLLTWNSRPNRGLSSQIRQSLRLWIPVVLTFGLFWTVKSVYFGQPLPNSYYVKLANEIFGTSTYWLPGFMPVVQFLLQRALPLTLLSVGAGLLVFPPRRVFIFALLLGPPALLVLLFGRVIHEAAGGFRHEYPLILPLFLGLGLCVARLSQKKPLVFVWVTLLAVVGFPLLSTGQSSHVLSWAQSPVRAATLWLGYRAENSPLARMGLDLRDTGLGERATILLSGAGQVPYYSGFRSIDWIGLNDARFSGRHAKSLDEVWEIIDSEQPDVVYSFLPPATPDVVIRDRDPAFRSPIVTSSLEGRGSYLFSYWDSERVADMFYREMCYIRDHYEFGAVYELWGDWDLIAYVRRDSPHRSHIQATLQNSRRADHDISLCPRYVNDPRSLGSHPSSPDPCPPPNPLSQGHPVKPLTRGH